MALRDLGQIYNSKVRVRCPGCGSRFNADIRRRPNEEGLHKANGTCPECGMFDLHLTVCGFFSRRDG